MQLPTHKRTILPPEFAGTMKFTGYKGIGKSWLAAQADLPANMMFMDFDQKGEGINSQLRFGKFHSMQSEASKGEIKSEPLVLFDYTMQVVNEIEQDRYTVVVLDNISPLEIAIRAEAIRHVDKYCKAFGLNKKNVIAGRYGGSNSIKNYWIGEFVAALPAQRGAVARGEDVKAGGQPEVDAGVPERVVNLVVVVAIGEGRSARKHHSDHTELPHRL